MLLKTSILPFGVVALTFLSTTASSAQTLYWDSDGSTPGTTNIRNTWDYSASRPWWSTSAAGDVATQAWTSGATAVFSAGSNATGYTLVDIGQGVDVSSIIVEEGDIELWGSYYSGYFYNLSSFHVDSGATAILDATLRETGGPINFTKTGAGTLTIKAPNETTGTSTFSVGTTNITNFTNLGSGNVTVQSGATLATASSDINGRTVTITGNGSLFSTAGSIDIGDASSATVNLESGGNFTTTDTIELGLVNGVTGTVSVTGAGSVLTVGSDLTLGYGGTGNLSLGSGGRIEVSDQLVLGTQSTGNGTLTLSSGGTLAIGGIDGIQKGLGTANLNLSGGTIEVTGSSLTTSAPATLNSGTESTINTNGLNAVLSGELSGSGGLIKAGSGILSLSSSNSYTGGTTVNVGTVQLGTVTSLGSTSGNLTLNGGTVDLGGYNPTLGSVIFNGGTFTNGSFGYVSAFEVQSGSLAVDLGGNAALTKTGSGAFTLSGNNSYAGGTTINDGILSVGSAASLGSGDITINSGTLAGSIHLSLDQSVIVDSSDATLTTVGYLEIGSAGTGSLTVTDGAQVTSGTSTAFGVLGSTNGTGNVTGTNSRLDANGVLYLGYLGSGELSIENGGTVTSSTTSFAAAGGSGTLNINTGGTFETGDIDSAGSSTLNLAGGTLKVTGSSFDSSIATTLVSSTTSTINTNGNNATLTGVLTGSGALTKSGTGSLTLSGSNDYAGSTTVSGGTLTLGSSTALGATASVDVASSATLDLNGNSVTIADLDAVGNIALGSGSLTTGDANNHTLSGIISGSGALTKSGTGSLTLSGSNEYSGGTTVSGGSLTISSDAKLGASSGTLAVTSGATLNTGGDFRTNRAVTLDGSGTSLTNNGELIVGNGGTGSLNLTNNATASTYNLTLGYNGGTGTVTIGSGSTVTVGNVTALHTATSTLNLNTGGTLTTADLSGSGTLNLAGGTLRSGAALNSSLPATLTNASTLDTNGFETTLSGNLTGTGSLTKSGAGNLTLSGTNDYSGGTTVSTGTLTGNTTSLQGNILNNANVVFDQTFTGTYANNLSGTGSFTKFGSGNLTLSGVNTYEGGTTISTGILTGNTTSLQGNILNNANVVFDQTFTGTYAGNLSGTGALTKSGSGNLTLSGINTYAGGTTLSGGTLTISSDAKLGASSGALAVTSGATLGTGGDFRTNRAVTLDGSGTSLVNNGELIIGNNGTGSLTLTNSAIASTYNLTLAYTGGTGILDISSGSTVTVGNVTSLGTASSTINLNTGGTLATAGLSGNGTFNLAGGTLRSNAAFNSSLPLNLSNDSSVDTNNYATTLSGNLSGTGSLTKVGSGTLTLSGANTYSGGTTVNAGILALTNGNTLQNSTVDIQGGSVSFKDITSANFGGLSGSQNLALTNEFSNAVALTIGGNNADTNYSGILSGSGSLTKTGSGNLTLSGANTFTGDTFIYDGTLTLGNIYALQASTLHTLTGLSFGNLTSANLGGLLDPQNLSLTNESSNAVALSLGGNNTDFHYSGVLSGSGSLTKTGSGNLTLFGANTYSGDTTISGGTLTLENINALQSSTLITTTGLSFGSLTSANLGGLSGSQNLALINEFSNAVALTIGGNNADSTYSGVLSGNGNLIKSGTGNLTLSGANTFTGDTFISGGTLTLGNSNALQGSTLSTTTGLSFGNLTSVNLGGLLDPQNLSLTNESSNAVALSLGGNNTDSHYSGVLSGSGSLTKTGSGNLTLFGANTYSGDTTISGGTLTLENINALQNSTLTTTTGLSFGSLTSANLGGLSGSQNLALTNDFSNPVALTIGGNNADSNYSGVLSGSGNLTKSGSGNLTLSGANTFTGDTFISGGTLTLGNSNALQGSTLITTTGLSFGNLTSANLGGLLDPQNLSLTNESSNAVALSLGGNNTDFHYSGVLSGSGSLTKTGTGNLTLFGANTYTGGTTINAGTLTLGHNNALGASGSSLSLNGGTIDLGTFSPELGAVTFDGGIFTNGSLENATSFEVLSGSLAENLSGAATLTKSGSGTFTLSGNNTFTGGTAINAGTLVMGNTSALGSGDVQLNGGTLDLGSFSPSLGTVLLSEGTITNGTLENISSLEAQSGTIDITLGGSTSLLKSGSGVVTLSVANSHTGGTTINAGVLVLGNPGALGGSSANVLLNGGTIDFNSLSPSIGTLSFNGGGLSSERLENVSVFDIQSGTVGYTLEGAGALTKTGSGSATLTGRNTYSGGTTISGGILTVSDTENLGSGAIAISSGAQLKAGSDILINRELTIDGASSLFGIVSIHDLNTIEFGSHGSGSVVATNGGRVESGYFNLTFGHYPGDVGTGSFSGAGGGLSSAHELIVGDQGEGSITVSDSANIDVSSAIILGFLAGSVGTLTVENGASISSHSVTIAYLPGSTGTLNLNQGGRWILGSGQAWIGAGNGTINLNGGSVELNINANLNLSVPMNLAEGSTSYFDTIEEPYTLTQSGILSGSGTLSKTGVGTLVLSAENTYTGGTVLDGGTLTLGNVRGLGAESGSLTLNAGVIDLGTFSPTLGTAIFNGGTFTNGSLDNAAAYEVRTGSLAENLAGSGSLTKTGAGTFVLSGSNSFSGSTSILEGTLQLGSNDALGSTASVDIASGSTLDLNGNSLTLADLDGAGNIALGASVLTTGDANTHALSGTISGTGSVIKTGSGNLTLSGSNTYTGATTVSGGTLRVDGSLASSAVSVESGATLAGSGSISGTVAIHDGGTIAPGNSPGTLSTGTMTFEGGGLYAFEINDAAGIAGNATGWDYIEVTGDLTIAASSENPFTIEITSLTGENEYGFISNFDETGTYAWSIAFASSGISGFGTDHFILDTSNFQNDLKGGHFGIRENRNILELTYTGAAVPEPSTWVMILGMLAFGYTWKRRRSIKGN